MLRDSPHASLPPGGSAMSGSEFARAVPDVRVPLLAVRGDEPIGHVALATHGGRKVELGRTYE